MTESRRLQWLLALAVVALCGCSAEPTAELSVFAASSLTDAFSELELRFEERHPDVDVRMTFAGSQVLRMQIEQGAPADLFASADTVHVDALRRRQLVDVPVVFATNELAIITPRGSAIDTFEDLPNAAAIVRGTAHVPVGAYARRMLHRSRSWSGGVFVDRVEAAIVSEESNVRLVRSKVEYGEADAAIVYLSDAVTSDSVEIVQIPDEVNVDARYYSAVVPGPRRQLALEFQEFLQSAEARDALVEHGFSANRLP